MKIVGVLAIQGAFIEHLNHFNKLIDSNERYSHLNVIKVITKDALSLCDALVIPGGESTAISLTAQRMGLLEPLRAFARDPSKPVWGTCAGLIFLASKISNGLTSQEALGGLDIEIRRNALGRQLESFIQSLDFSNFIEGCNDFPAVFIRAPVVTGVNISRRSINYKALKVNPEDQRTIYAPDFTNLEFETEVQILAELDENHHNLIVAVRQGHKLGTSFHPELSDNTTFHQWFLDEFVCKI